MEEIRITIIGAGVVGLAVAAELSKSFGDILVVEKNDKFGQETSSRNSEVIHSGIYYPHRSLKALLCVEGARMLYDYCGEHGVPFMKTGKFIVAVEPEEKTLLEELMKKGERNGVRGLRLLEKPEVSILEPAVNAIAAIHSPDTGIIDSHAFMKRLYNSAKSRGVLFSFRSEVDYISKEKGRYAIGIKKEKERLCSRVVVNSAGLSSDYVAGLAGIDTEKCGYRLSLCKGSYFSYSKSSPVKSLVYPVPHQDLTGLGVHATIDLGGRLRFGPDTENVDSIDYLVDENKRGEFFKGASKIIKGLDENALHPDMAGIRPKIRGEGVKDFVISHERDKGMDGFINLIGIESPGLTSALAIAGYVNNLLKENLN